MRRFDTSRFLIRAWRARLRDQKSELGAIRRHIRSGDIVCDVGANKGSYTYWLARWSGTGQVVAFEPQPDLAARLAKNCSKLGLKNVIVERQAAYSACGVQKFFIPDGHQPAASLSRPDGPFASLEVRTTSLDAYFTSEQRISVLKIDVEGSEFHVLKGAGRILQQDRPLIVFECEQRHLPQGVSVSDVFSFLFDLGYEGSFVCRGKLLPINLFDVTSHQKQDGEWFWKDKGYCNNFVFKHSKSIR